MEGDQITSVLTADESKWREIVQLHAPYLFRLIGRFFRNRQMVEDLAQETFFRAFRYRKSYRSKVPLKYWLSRIAVRLCYDALRKKKNLAEISVSDINPDAVDELKAKLFCGNQKQNADPETGLITRELLEIILAHLSEKDRMILILTAVEGMTTKETAGLMGLTTAGVKMRIYRARRSVLQKIDETLKIKPEKMGQEVQDEAI
ncbi:RNA polymerase sigma factor [Desulfosarcina sp. BuS5]|uniref:RNA polymerase sigma factor n=1 Tax=Desulfosarcina sp. BuS5 TaxID=933262 RepID=UPI0004885C3F|nr:RNA polymerase sigma factor [Desulfosarcina sp. BuS5]